MFWISLIIRYAFFVRGFFCPFFPRMLGYNSSWHLFMTRVYVLYFVTCVFFDRIGNWFKPPGLNHLTACVLLAGINSILPGLNRFKPVKTTGWHKSI